MFESNVSLKTYSNYKIGGPARYFYQAEGVRAMIEALTKARRESLPVFILGAGTNLLISDEGFPGLVVKPNIHLLDVHGDRLRVGASALMSDVLNVAAERGLSGLEWAGGLPGTVGGAIRGNAGAFGGETKDAVVEVVSLDVVNDSPRLVWRNNEQCRFGYRDSVFKRSSREPSAGSPREIILEVSFQLRPGDSAVIKQAIEEKMSYRYQRHPMEYPNIGSIFKNVDWETVPRQHRDVFQHKVKQDPFPILPTAVLVDRCGLRGVSFGGAMISPRHPNFIVNSLDASAGDARQLIQLVKKTVKEKFGIELEEEIQYV